MGKPAAFAHFHIGKDGTEGGVFWAAGIDTEGYLSLSCMKMADPHLGEVFSILGAFDTEVILSAAETIPHGFYRGIDGSGGPVGVACIGDNTTQMGEVFVFKLTGALQPVFGV